MQIEMTIQCNACEVAEAKVLCCTDKATLCWGCDQKIHAANKLTSKHQRVPLSSSSSSSMPKCDICQVKHDKREIFLVRRRIYLTPKCLSCDSVSNHTIGYFFCLEDRALLCRKCDVAIHTTNSYVYGHQRLLLRVKVGFEATEPCISSSTKEKLSSVETVSESASSRSIPRTVIDHFSTDEIKDTIAMQNGGIGTLVSDKIPFNRSTTASTGNILGWHHLEEYLG